MSRATAGARVDRRDQVVGGRVVGDGPVPALLDPGLRHEGLVVGDRRPVPVEPMIETEPDDENWAAARPQAIDDRAEVGIDEPGPVAADRLADAHVAEDDDRSLGPSRQRRDPGIEHGPPPIELARPLVGLRPAARAEPAEPPANPADEARRAGRRRSVGRCRRVRSRGSRARGSLDLDRHAQSPSDIGERRLVRRG